MKPDESKSLGEFLLFKICAEETNIKGCSIPIFHVQTTNSFLLVP